MPEPIRILMQTTTRFEADMWASPSFVEEASSEGYKRNPQGLNDIKTYASNAARWLAQR